MKKYLISSIVAAAVLCSCAQPKQQTGYRIDGEIAGVAGKVYLTVFEGKLPRVIDSAEVKNGAFEFSGDCAVPIFAAVEPPDVPLVRFFLENSPMIRIVGAADRPQDIRVTGSATEDLYRQFLGQVDSVAKLLDSDSVKLSSTRIAFDLEWNSKDQTFDRDLLAMRTYYDCDLVSAGIIITRSAELNDIFKTIYDYDGKTRQWKPILRKYGASTTWMGKLTYRLDSRRNGGCPILAVGIRKPCITDWEEAYIDEHNPGNI